MSIATPSLSGAWLFRSARRFLPRAHFLGWADQAVVSGTRLLLLVMIGRWASPAELGGYGVALSIIALSIATNESLITRPYSIQLHKNIAPKEHAFSALVLGTFLCLATCGVCLIALFLFHQVGQSWASFQLSIALSAALPLIVLREQARRFSFAHLRLGVALLLDCAVAGLTLLAVIVLAHSDALNAAKAIWATGIACGLVFCGWLYSVRTEFSWTLSQLRPTFRRSWAMGKWFLWNQLAMQVQGYMAPWLVLTICSASTSGILVACTTVVGFANPMLFGYFNVLLPKFVRILRQGGIKALRREAVLDALMLSAIMGVFSFVVGIFGSEILHLLYPAEAYAGFEGVLLILSIAAFAGAIGAPAAIALAAAERARTLAYIMTGSALFSLIVIAALLPKFGLPGAAYGVLMGEIFATVGRWTQFLRLVPTVSSKPGTAQEFPSSNIKAAEKNELSSDNLFVTARVGVLQRVFASLQSADIRYCLLQDYGEFFEETTSDIDCIVPRDIRPTDLLRVLEDRGEYIGAEVVRACGAYFVLAIPSARLANSFVALDFVRDSAVGTLPVYCGEEFLASRRRYGDFYVPRLDIEFGSRLARAIAKHRLDAKHTDRLAQLFSRDDAACSAQIYRHWRGTNAEILLTAARSNDWSLVRLKISNLRRELIARSVMTFPLQILSNKAAAISSRLARLTHPHGISLCVLGPDGAGKSTLVESLAEKLAPVFPHHRLLGFAPSPLALFHSTKRDTRDPHGRPPRSSGASWLRAGYWLAYYFAERFSLRVARARATLVLYDRHFLDILVDQDRYRYGGPRWLLRVIAAVVTKPDFIILLDASPATLQSRKQEVPFAVTAIQRQAYLDLVRRLSNARIVDASAPLPKVTQEVTQLLLSAARQRALNA